MMTIQISEEVATQILEQVLSIEINATGVYDDVAIQAYELLMELQDIFGIDLND